MMLNQFCPAVPFYRLRWLKASVRCLALIPHLDPHNLLGVNELLVCPQRIPGVVAFSTGVFMDGKEFPFLVGWQ